MTVTCKRSSCSSESSLLPRHACAIHSHRHAWLRYSLVGMVLCCAVDAGLLACSRAPARQAAETPTSMRGFLVSSESACSKHTYLHTALFYNPTPHTCKYCLYPGNIRWIYHKSLQPSNRCRRPEVTNADTRVPTNSMNHHIHVDVLNNSIHSCTGN